MRQIKIGLVVFPGFQVLDIAGPRDAFAEAGVLSDGACSYDMRTVGTTDGPISSSNGLAVVPDCTIFDPDLDFDTVIVPGGHGIFEAHENPELVAWLQQQYQRVRRVSAICNGVFALGSAGLIDNRAVTTHWMDVPRLATTFRGAGVARLAGGDRIGECPSHPRFRRT
jgi:transcriptional regulator GlxA family with amidase domain